MKEVKLEASDIALLKEVFKACFASGLVRDEKSFMDIIALRVKLTE